MHQLRSSDMTIFQLYSALETSSIFYLIVPIRDVYRYQKSIRYVSSTHCFYTRHVSSILICSKYQDKQVPVLMTDPPEPHFNMCTTSQDSGLVRNGTQESVWSGMGSLFGQKR